MPYACMLHRLAVSGLGIEGNALNVLFETLAVSKAYANWPSVNAAILDLTYSGAT